MDVMENKNAKLELLGIGSAKNRALKANLEEALRQLGLDIPIEEIRDIHSLMRYDISGIPALALNGKVIFQRIVPQVEDIKIVLRVLLQSERSQPAIENLLIPIDFSATAENAFYFGVELAGHLGADVHILHIDQEKPEFGTTLRLDAKGGELAYKRRLMNALRERGLETASKPLEIRTEIVQGEVVREICSRSEKDGVLVVMGTTGEGGLFGRWMGSTSLQVARCAESPVLLVPNGVRFKGFGKILYASSRHPSEEIVLPQLLDFARPFGSNVCFAHIKENTLYPYQVLPDTSGRVFHKNGLTLQLSTIESQDVVEGLSRFAEETTADLLVMATTHRNFLEELFHKSATKKMIYNTRIPLMILHY